MKKKTKKLKCGHDKEIGVYRRKVFIECYTKCNDDDCPLRKEFKKRGLIDEDREK